MQSPAARDLALDSASHSGLRTDHWHVLVYVCTRSEGKEHLWLSFKPQ